MEETWIRKRERDTEERKEGNRKGAEESRKLKNSSLLLLHPFPLDPTLPLLPPPPQPSPGEAPVWTVLGGHL